MPSVKVQLSNGEQLEVKRGTTIAEILRKAGVPVDLPCGGRGKCNQCKVNIRLLEDTKIEQVLSCSYKVEANIWIELPRELDMTQRVILASGKKDEDFVIDSGFKKQFTKHQNPIANSYWHAIQQLCKQHSLKLSPNLRLLQNIAKVNLKYQTEGLTIISSGPEVIDIENGDTTKACYGLAVDIGTTTVVGYLVDLLTGQDIAVESSLNAQRAFGADVISRINAVSSDQDNLGELQRNIIDTISRIVDAITQKTGVSPQNIYAVTLAGNTCMQHLLLGLDPTRLGKSPFLPVIQQPVEVCANELNLAINPLARVWVFPVIAGFVGGDTVAAILASGLHRKAGIRLLVDIGTNGELVLNAHGRMFTCSAAAGPALEGAQITFGMRAETGAVSKVQLFPNIKLESIGQGPIKGICGSGLIDLIAELIKVKLINRRGKLANPEGFNGPTYLKERLVKTEKGVRFVLLTSSENQGQEIYLSQEDVSQLQMAKGALRAAMELLIKKAGYNGADVDELLLAGAFGNFMNIEQAIVIGLLPEWSAGLVKQIGNAAGVGAKIALLATDKRKEAEEINRMIEFVELAGTEDFHDAFIQGMLFRTEN